MDVEKTIKMKKKFLLLLINLFLILALAITYSLGGGMLKNNDFFNNTQQITKELEWKFIQSVLDENLQIGEIYSDELSVKIESSIREKYPDLSILENCLTDRNIPDELYDILRDGITNNSAEDGHMSIMMPWGILMDLSKDHSRDDEGTESLRLWETELEHQINKTLYSNTIQKIFTSSDSILYIEMEKNGEHTNIPTPTLANLKKVFDEKGIEGIKNIEFIVPSYITETGDIFGVHDVSNSGFLTKNNKIVVVYGFNLYDMLVEKHSGTLDRFDNYYSELVQRQESTKTFVITCEVFMILLICAMVIALSVLYNHECNKHECNKHHS